MIPSNDTSRRWATPRSCRDAPDPIPIAMPRWIIPVAAALLTATSLTAQRPATADTMPVCPGVEQGRVATMLEQGQLQPAASDTADWNPVLNPREAGLRLRNASVVRSALVRNYPEQLREGG